jgi:hypothetical protein
MKGTNRGNGNPWGLPVEGWPDATTGLAARVLDCNLIPNSGAKVQMAPRFQATQCRQMAEFA